MTIPEEMEERAYVESVLKVLDELFNSYHDPEGQYTSGRGVIGALRDDMVADLNSLDGI
jgi:hypothetical protein